MKLFTGKWSWGVCGTLLGVFMVMMLYVFDDTIGMNNGMLVFSDYCKDVLANGEDAAAPELNWQVGFLVGIFIGALAAALMSGGWKIKTMPNREGGIFKAALRGALTGLGGGFLVMLGLQLSGDSFLGQLGSAVQMSSGSWIFLIALFATGVITSILIERYSEKEEEE